jgi:anti-anti-sigma regulatory factor
MAMLKITSIEGQKRNRVVVEGRLDAPWTTELRRACEKAQADLHGRELVVQLKHLTAISQEGENILLDLMKGGVKICGSGVFAKQILKQLTRRPDPNIQEATR